MSLFMSTYTNRVDAKGRISVPARFRAVLAEQGMQGVFCFPSFTERCIEGVTLRQMEEFTRMIDDFSPFDEPNADFAHAILADCQELSFDKEGRILLPEEFRAHAAIEGEASFVGLGRRFQIWEPSAAAEHKATRREAAKNRRGLLNAAPRADRSSGAAAAANGEGGS